VYHTLVETEKAAGRFATHKPFLRGGIWRNFMSRYPEANWMHKRMLGLSQRLAELPENTGTPAQRAEMQAQLHRAQANDAYWHGLFGGLYLPHLRRAIYNAIVRLEAMLDAVSPRPQRSQQDIDLDGDDEIFLQNGTLQAVVRLDGSGSVCEFDSYRLAHNFGDTLARQTEHYHRKVHANHGHGYSGEGIANPHERVSFKHEIFAEDLATDPHGLTLFRDSWLPRDGAEAQPVAYAAPRNGKTAAVAFSGAVAGGQVDKKLALKDNALHASYRFDNLHGGMLRVLIHLAMPSCDGPAGRFRIGDDIPGGFGQPLHLASMKEIVLEDGVLGGALKLSSSVPCMLNTHPHFSVSQSEAGFEKIMQAVTLELSWHMNAIAKGVDLQLEVA
jgi:hypothetical protein